jgi:hypothetical protein
MVVAVVAEMLTGALAVSLAAAEAAMVLVHIQRVQVVGLQLKRSLV